MKFYIRMFCLSLILLTVFYCGPKEKTETSKYPLPWFGFHLITYNNEDMDNLIAQIPRLNELGVNAVIAEINYCYEFETHPELRDETPIGKERVKKLVKVCKEHNVRLIPQFSCLGHQSWAEKTFPLLTKYPQFDETPGQYPNNDSIYCRSWCPLHPEVNPIIFDLMGELLTVFEADAMHVGLDEVFLIASDFCSRCKGKNPASLYAKAINDYHQFLVKEKNVEMMMWGDRLIDSAATEYGKWEAAANGTHPAVDSIPKDIIICDWHYEVMDEYPSVPMFVKKGFRVWPSSWRDTTAALKYYDYCDSVTVDCGDCSLMLGHLSTIWRSLPPNSVDSLASLLKISEKMKPLLNNKK